MRRPPLAGPRYPPFLAPEISLTSESAKRPIGLSLRTFDPKAFHLPLTLPGGETMKVRLLSALVVGLATGFVLPIVAQQKDAFDPEISQQIRVLAKKHDEAVNKHDAAAIAALYTR